MRLFIFFAFVLQAFSLMIHAVDQKDVIFFDDLQKRFLLSSPSKLFRYREVIKFIKPTPKIITKTSANESIQSRLISILNKFKNIMIANGGKKYNEKIWMNRFG